MRSLFILIGLSFLSCDGPHTSTASFWKGQDASFRYQNKKEFVSDSTLKAELIKLKKSYHPLFKQLRCDSVYLYSWQGRDNKKTEFTVVKDEGNYGLSLYYLILNEKDSLLSFLRVAGMDNEGDHWYEVKSKFTSPDTIITTQSLWQGYDLATRKKFGQNSVSTYCRAIDSNGEMVEIHDVLVSPSLNKPPMETKHSR